MPTASTTLLSQVGSGPRSKRIKVVKRAVIDDADRRLRLLTDIHCMKLEFEAAVYYYRTLS